MYLKSLHFFFLVMLCLPLSVRATHNRAGEITYEQIGELTIRATITTYTKASSVPADRDSLLIEWGDGTSQFVRRSNGNGELLPNDTKKNYYTAEHTYPGRAHYILSMTDPNRNGGILNVNPPNSDNVPFHLETTITFLNLQFQGFNNSPVLLQPPIDFGCIGKPFIHNPNAYDIDGDSLAYFLIVPLQDIGTQVPNYSYPSQISPSINNNMSLNPITGDFVWNAPQVPGEYNIAMIIVEYRNGNPLDTLIRDMQILIETCDNNPPVINTLSTLCVVAGQEVNFEVMVTDPDNDKVLVTALGGPFEVATNPATFNAPTTFSASPLTTNFRWQTDCNHVSDQYYSVVFRAVDDAPSPVEGLSTLKTVRIKVVAPPPLDVQATAEETQTVVSWELPYTCEIALNNYFRGFSVWRREGSNNFEIDTCVTGLEGRGYTKLIFNTNTQQNGRYQYIDEALDRGKTYCYRIVANFAKLSPGGNPYNAVESLPSEEACIQIGRDVPLLTKVSVEETDALTGKIRVEWTRPIAADLDTLANPGPYTYQLQRATGLSGTDFSVVAAFTQNTISAPVDTFYTDNALNTVATAYVYKIVFYTQGNTQVPFGESEPASSVFLSVAASDRLNLLSWQANVPWENFAYTIFKQNPSGGFDSLTTTTQPTFTDTGLTNGIAYCYKIETYGTYGIENVISPLRNFSQVACGTPLDTVPPCATVLQVLNTCNAGTTLNFPDTQNQLSWQLPVNFCPNATDVVAYNVYYAATEGENLTLLETLTTAQDTSLLHQPDAGIAGCYAVTAVDSVGNESPRSNVVCVDNCPIYTLPNAFTPNGDGQNEVFRPYPYRFIERVEFKVFNRWGAVVFSTTNPDLLWNGTGAKGEVLPSGTYFYTCQVYERRVTGIVSSGTTLSGYIELLRD